MKTNQQAVLEFTDAFNMFKTSYSEYSRELLINNPKTSKLRYDLIFEEYNELLDAFREKDIVEVIDALTDILYVTYGAGHAFGIDLDKCFDEVQRSNMSKLGENGKPIYNEQGKVMKGPKYFEPNLSKFIKS